MNLQPRAEGLHERILVFGPEGGGKSTTTLSVAVASPGRKYWIIDNDNAVDFLLQEDEHADELAKRDIEVFNIDKDDFDEQLILTQKLAKKVKPGDFFTFDGQTPLYNAVQDWYTEKVLGMSLDDWKIIQRQKLEATRASQQAKGGRGNRTAPLFDQLRDWPTIKSHYGELEAAITKINVNAHVLLTAHMRDLRDDTPVGIRRIYRGIGGFPEGSPTLRRFPHTILGVQFDYGDDHFVMTTFKDRGARRQRALRDMPFKNFALRYLRNTAGWVDLDAPADTGAKKKGKKKSGAANA